MCGCRCGVHEAAASFLSDFSDSRLPRHHNSVDLSACGSRTDNLFKELEARELSGAEQDIIAQRVAFQRRMLEEYEKRERQRKVARDTKSKPVNTRTPPTSALSSSHNL
jgi:hypothetical protein